MKTSIDTEWVAFLAGAKPALRRTAEPSHADTLESRLRAQGACVVRARFEAVFGGRAQAVLYAARSLDAAEALRDAEEALLPGTPAYVRGAGEAQRARHRAVGAALGFPVCCVEAFCARLMRGVDTLADGSARGLAEDYVAARDAWVPRADGRLNHLLFQARVQLVSFYPCRYDCPVAVAYADGVLAAVRATHGEAAALEIRETLSKPMVVAPTGARAWAAIDAYDGSVWAASAPTDDAPARELAGAIVGKRVREDGAVEGVEGMTVEPWAVRFG